MKHLILFLTCICFPLLGFSQTTTTIYASGPSGSYTTGSAVETLPAGTYARSDGVIAASTSATTIQAGYAVFDLASIPVGAVISKVILGVDCSGFTGSPGAPGTCVTYGNAANFSTITTPATLFADCQGAGGTMLWSSTVSVSSGNGSYGNYVGNVTMASTTVSSPAACNFIQAQAGNTAASISFNVTSVPTSYVYNFTGETGALSTSGLNAPYLQITFSGTGSIGGVTTVCRGSATTLSDAIPGGVWSSSNTAVATVVSATGVVYGVTAGTVTISYSVSGAVYTTTVTVSSCIATITGTTTICAGSTTNLSDATPGGTWSSSNITIATVGSSSGTVSGITAGIATISYTVSGASVSTTVTVSNCIATITGNTTVCTGSTTALSDATPGGVWSSSNTSVATISATGIVYGITAGAATVSYTVAGSGSATTTITVTNATSPGTISGTSTTYAGATATLTETVSGGTWSSSVPAVATINASTGVYTGVSVGTSVITYTVSGCSGIATTTYTITVTAINGISGYVNFSGSACAGNIKVWLITYSTSAMVLAAVDSSLISCSGSNSVYYQFVGPITDSYRVKAAVVYTPTVTTGYIPTYHTSSFYWYAANVIYHTSGTADINEDINMAYGTVTSGPGFIAGNVTAGANRGTSTGIPVVGLSVNLLNSTTTQLMQSTTTDINGNYSFSDLPAGTYYVFPDSLNYLTTPYTDITLSTGSDSMTAANFIQHTISKTITPGTTAVNNINQVASSVFVYPNPTHDQLTITSTDNITNILITNIVGQTIYTYNYNSPQVQMSVANLPTGVYFVKVNVGSAGLTMTRKFVKE